MPTFFFKQNRNTASLDRFPSHHYYLALINEQEVYMGES